MDQYPIVACPRCGRDIATQNGRFWVHSTVANTRGRCPMSKQLAPITGHTADDFAARAHLVANLAWQLRDEDPAITWDYLTALPAEELQRITMIALAGLRVDQTVDEMFSWVADLPAAKAVA